MVGLADLGRSFHFNLGLREVWRGRPTLRVTRPESLHVRPHLISTDWNRTRYLTCHTAPVVLNIIGHTAKVGEGRTEQSQNSDLGNFPQSYLKVFVCSFELIGCILLVPLQVFLWVPKFLPSFPSSPTIGSLAFGILFPCTMLFVPLHIICIVLMWKWRNKM